MGVNSIELNGTDLQKIVLLVTLVVRGSYELTTVYPTGACISPSLLYTRFKAPEPHVIDSNASVQISTKGLTHCGNILELSTFVNASAELSGRLKEFNKPLTVNCIHLRANFKIKAPQPPSTVGNMPIVEFCCANNLYIMYGF